MKKILCILLLLFISVLLISCAENPSADDMLSEFLYSYGADGVVYSWEKHEGEDGYVGDGLMTKIFTYEGDFPEKYAIFLNSHIDYGSECGFFVTNGEVERAKVTDMCEERILLLTKGDGRGFILREGNVVFYSTMKDKELAERLAGEILKRNT